MMLLGMEVVRMKPSASQKISTRRFRGAFGISTAAVAAVFNDLQETEIMSDAKPKDLLFALKWMKGYPTEEQKGSTKTEKTQRKNDWKYAMAIQALKEFKVRKEKCTLANIRLCRNVKP